jgi:hypothetical protein
VSSGDAPPLRAFSEDVGPHGCQLVAPRTFTPGSTLRLELQAEEPREALRAIGTVAWASPRDPWRVGLAFGESSRPSATRFFDALVAKRPGLAAWRKVPDRISYDAMIWLAPPPRLVVDFTPGEVTVLRAVGSGATLYELRSRLPDGWAVGQRSFYSLLSSGFITLSRGGSVPYSNWSALLGRLESEQAVAALAPAAPVPTPEARTVAPPGGSTPGGLDDLRDWPAPRHDTLAPWPPVPPSVSGKGRC